MEHVGVNADDPRNAGIISYFRPTPASREMLLRAFERAPHRRWRRERNLDRRIGARIAQLRTTMDLDRPPRDPLPLDLGDRRARKPIRDGGDPNERFDAKGLVDSLCPLRGDVGQSHAIGREQRRKWMDEDG